MAYGLRFYKNFLTNLEKCESTANFCEWINNLFYSLNRTNSCEGVTPGDSNCMVISNCVN